MRVTMMSMKLKIAKKKNKKFSEICDNLKILSLDNKSEITNELKYNNKNNDYEVDHCNFILEGLDE
jgi:hypothetical protein